MNIKLDLEKTKFFLDFHELRQQKIQQKRLTLKSKLWKYKGKTKCISSAVWGFAITHKLQYLVISKS